MVSWLLILILSLTLSLTLTLKHIITFHNTKNNLPPSSPTVPFLGNLLWLYKSFTDIETTLDDLRRRYGPIVTLFIGPRPIVFITDPSLIHQSLIMKASVFSDRPPADEPSLLFTSGQRNISFAHYGPLWRTLRRNLTTGILHPTRIRSYVHRREEVCELLLERLRSEAEEGGGVCAPMRGFQYAMLMLLLLMSFGEEVGEDVYVKMDALRHSVVVFNLFPKLSKIAFRGRWRSLLDLRRELDDLLIPLVRSRRHNTNNNNSRHRLYSYVDTLLDLKLTDDEGARALDDREVVTLLFEFLMAGADTTTASLQWTIAHLAKSPRVQERLAREVVSSSGEEDIPYLKAVIMEVLRIRPPGMVLLPHMVSEDVTVNGYVIPKGVEVNVPIAAAGRDGRVWEEAMEFKPERFLGEDGRLLEVDMMGRQEIIKMMPFGVGRRVCPGEGLAMVNLEYFLARLVREFEWRAVEGEEIDMAAKMEITVVMKKPVRVRIRARNC
ncbi:Cytochrome P450 89A9 [Acorus calamus]|uniref:Cytochrome P450 89A9 n=1 Tax=Acorus calamus TaxID=4465 RepID=A0AAV9D8B5_ACOCL|nr:Cytochrome P450 89A9 [Acorus calamus]